MGIFGNVSVLCAEKLRDVPHSVVGWVCALLGDNEEGSSKGPRLWEQSSSVAERLCLRFSPLGGTLAS